MGLRKRTLIKHPGIFFVTLTLKDHKPYFKGERRKIAKDTLLEACQFHSAVLIAYVIMSTHIHLSVFVPDGNALSKLIFSIKGMIRKRLVSDRDFWENRFDDKLIKSEEMLLNTIEYIHYNPVRAGLVENVNEYEFSSANVWSGVVKDSRIQTNLNELPV